MGGYGGTALAVIGTAPLSVVSVFGTISMNGAAGSTTGTCGGGGAGGSVAVNASIVMGSGAITAKGGQGGSASCTSFGGAGGGGRIAIVAPTMTFNGTLSACGAASLSGSYAPGGAGTVYVDVGDGISVQNRTLTIDNCGLSGGPVAVLATPSQQAYTFETVVVTRYGALSAVRPTSGNSNRAAVTIGQLLGDKTGRVFAANGTDVTILGWSVNLTDSSSAVETIVSYGTVNGGSSSYSGYVEVDIVNNFYPNSVLLTTSLTSSVGGRCGGWGHG